jgi:hypothetical protein
MWRTTKQNLNANCNNTATRRRENKRGFVAERFVKTATLAEESEWTKRKPPATDGPHN